jgi:hypothetical protein
MQKSIRIDKESYSICKQRLDVNERYRRIYIIIISGSIMFFLIFVLFRKVMLIIIKLI